MRFDLVDDLHRTHLWSTRNCAGRQASSQSVKGAQAGLQLTGHIGCDMHDVTVAFDNHHIAEFD